MFPTPEDEIRMQGQVEYGKEKAKELREHKPGDMSTFWGAVIGVISGIVIGVKTWHGSYFWLMGCLIAGGITGTLFGSLVGFLITKYRRSRDNLKYY